jgi:hypothetical protein
MSVVYKQMHKNNWWSDACCFLLFGPNFKANHFFCVILRASIIWDDVFALICDMCSIGYVFVSSCWVMPQQCQGDTFSATGATVCTACSAGKYILNRAGGTESSSCKDVSVTIFLMCLCSHWLWYFTLQKVCPPCMLKIHKLIQKLTNTRIHCSLHSLHTVKSSTLWQRLQL